MKNAIIVAGPNGAGKTTFAEKYLDVHALEYISADKIALKLNPEEPSKVRVQAGKLFFQGIEIAVESGRDLLIEVTLSGRGFRRTLHRLKQAGYAVHLIFIFLNSPDLCVNRVRERVAQGGHGVPEEDITRRFYRSITNFWRIYKDIVDTWNIYSNFGADFHRVAVGEKGDHERHEKNTKFAKSFASFVTFRAFRDSNFVVCLRG